MPRESYPEGRDAYLKWRKDLAQMHAQIAARLMLQAGYTSAHSDRVSQIILKKRIKADPEVQTIENALCLVFLEYQYEEFVTRYANEPDKLVNILHRSLLKMDAHGHAFAIQLNYSAEGTRLVQQAIALL